MACADVENRERCPQVKGIDLSPPVKPFSEQEEIDLDGNFDHVDIPVESLDEDEFQLGGSSIRFVCKPPEQYSSTMSSENNLSQAVSFEEDVERHLSSERSSKTNYTAGGFNVSNSLQIARYRGQWRLLRLRGPTYFLGTVLILGGFYFAWQAMSVRGKRIALLLHSIALLLLMMGILALATSLLPTDKRCIYFSIVVVGLPSCLSGIANSVYHFSNQLWMVSMDRCSFDNTTRPCWFTATFAAANIVVMFASFLAFVALLIIITRTRAAELVLKRLWRVIGVVCFVLGVAAIARCLACWIWRDHFQGTIFALNAVVSFASAWFCFHYKVIILIQSWLMSRGEAATAAAGVSELLGGQEPDDVLKVARKTFVTVRANRITKDAMCLSCPDPELSALAQRTNLGHADAFVSHSWHDDPDMKWRELQKWCSEFKKSHGREPKLWIDKYCIDQNSIEKSLACLPVYLSGCSKFLVLCGKTYLKRLWCLIEIFAFLEMGGKLENLEVRLLGNRKVSHASCRSIDSLAQELFAFDSLSASCSNDDDTIRLKGILEMIGSNHINSLVSNVFVGKLAEEGCNSISSLVSIV